MASVKEFLSKSIKKGFFVYLFLVLFLLLHLYLVSKTFVFDDKGNIRTAYSGYGDIPFHMSQVSKFGFGSLFDFNESLFNGTKIKYSFLINYLSGILLKFTDSWTFSMHAPTMVLLAGSYLFLFLIFKNILKTRWAALLAIIIFFLGSGILGYIVVKDNYIGQDISISSFVKYLTDNNIFTFTNLKAIYPQQNTDWSSPLSLSFLHQRSFFLGLFLFVVFFYFLLFKLRKYPKKINFILPAIALGLGPLGHYHTFLVMLIVAGFYLLKSIFTKDFEFAKRVFTVCIIAGIIALPQVIYLLSGQSPDVIAGNSSLVKFRLGWMSELSGLGAVQYPKGELPGFFERAGIYLYFLWTNFGFILPFLALGLLIRSVRSSMSDYYWLAGIIFAVNNFLQFQPWDYDNNKILVYFGFFASLIMVATMVSIINKLRYFGVFISAVMLILVIFSGVIDVIPRYSVKRVMMPVIFNKDAVRTAYYIRQNIDNSDVILATTTHLNIVASLAGRPTVVGFAGWLWTKGIIFAPREEDLKKFYLDPVGNMDIASKYGARYALIDPVALYEWNADQEIFDSNFARVYNSGGYTLYKLP